MAAFVILTEPFREMANAILEFQETDRPLPAIILDHPIQNLSPEKVLERARQLADAVERLLNGEELE